MANPQKENGYTPISNEIIDALCRTRLSGEVSQIVYVIFRKTYGFNKKQDAISITQFESMTSMPRCSVTRAIKKAQQNKIIKIDRTKYITIYSLNKNYEEWVVTKKYLPNKTQSRYNNVPRVGTKKRTELGTILRTTKDKRQYTKDISEQSSPKLKTKNKTMTYEEPVIDIETGDVIPTQKEIRKKEDARVKEKAEKIIAYIEQKLGIQFPTDPKARNMHIKDLKELMGTPEKPRYLPSKIIQTYEDLFHLKYWQERNDNPTFKTVAYKLNNTVL